MERSEYEKSIIAYLVDESEALPYPMRTITSDIFDDEKVYIIPEEVKETLFKELWPLINCPDIDEELWDIHQEAATSLRKCQVLRWHNRNVLVSEFYETSGGMLVDLLKSKSNVIDIQIVK